jgi:hypothetical protein
LSEEKLQTENSPEKTNTHHIAKKFIELCEKPKIADPKKLFYVQV